MENTNGPKIEEVVILEPLEFLDPEFDSIVSRLNGNSFPPFKSKV